MAIFHCSFGWWAVLHFCGFADGILLTCLSPQRAMVSAGLTCESQKGFCVSPNSEVMGMPAVLLERGELGSRG